MIQRFLLLLLISSLIGCAPSPENTPPPTVTSLPSTMGEAHDVLSNFFALLSAKKYEEADALYGGSYEQMQAWNPDIDPSDHAALWTRACEQNGLRCLKVRSATFKTLRGDTYVFQVEFSNPDGGLFVLGPCCGADETEMPPVSQFEYEVDRVAGGKFVILNMPPYVP